MITADRMEDLTNEEVARIPRPQMLLLQEKVKKKVADLKSGSATGFAEETRVTIDLSEVLRHA